MRTTLVGRFSLPISRETVFVVAHALEESPGFESIRAPGQLLPGFTHEHLKRIAEEGSLRGIALGADDDGTRWFMDARGVPATRSSETPLPKGHGVADR
jgi:hypothetical protein